MLLLVLPATAEDPRNLTLFQVIHLQRTSGRTALPTIMSFAGRIQPLMTGGTGARGPASRGMGEANARPVGGGGSASYTRSARLAIKDTVATSARRYARRAGTIGSG
jgi:hypothetical protein